MKCSRFPVRAAVFSVLMTMVACSTVTPGSEDRPAKAMPTLADLQPAVMPDTRRALPRVDLDTLTSTYRDVLAVTDDPELRLRVLHRLAGLEMKRGEQKLDAQNTATGQFDLAIEAYRALLRANPHHPGNDQLLYQLSRAYDLEGLTDKSMATLGRLVKNYPESEHYLEAQFRRADVFFSRSDYRDAELAYADVIGRGKGSVYYVNALYMHGWAQFKRERYRASLQSFTAVLDVNVPPDNRLDALGSGQRELTQDTLRVMSVVFSYLGGPGAIANVYNSFGERHYMPLLYDSLGKLYLEKQRFRDSAEAYRAYVNKYPRSDLAPVFYSRLIDAYIAGGFSTDVLAEKQRYVAEYGIHSVYWRQKSESSRGYIRPFLAKYLPELARHFHARAQQKTALLTAATGAKNAARHKRLRSGERDRIQRVAIDQYLKAGYYYQEFIDTFPNDKRVAEMYFLLAESRFAAGVYDAAARAYEVVAYKYSTDKRGATAGYSAIVAYGRLLSAVPRGAQNPEYEKWLRLKIASQLKFATIYSQDSRAPAVLTKSAEELLALKAYPQAIQAAGQLVKRRPLVDPGLRKTAWLVIGHSTFALHQYADAETAYTQALQLMARRDPTRQPIVDRLAASVYKQGEQQLAAGNREAAAAQFLRVASVAPTSPISITAQYDAATAFMNAANWTAAIGILENFRRNYPHQPLSANIPEKLVVAYRKNGQWAKAADELSAIYRHSKDLALKRESLYQAAQLYEKAGAKAQAVLRYRLYANTYPDPFPIAMEARYRLSELYRETGQPSKRRFWLKKIIVADRSAGSRRTERSRYLAASSAAVLADDNYQVFVAIKLRLPLKTTLKRKKRAFNAALKAYRTVVDYGEQEFTTLATFRIGEIYRQLGRALLESQRPPGLDPLALEQYELLLEEKADPFQEKAIDIHEANSRRSWKGIYDRWVKQSFKALKTLLPARYDKQERGVVFANEIY